VILIQVEDRAISHSQWIQLCKYCKTLRRCTSPVFCSEV